MNKKYKERRGKKIENLSQNELIELAKERMLERMKPEDQKEEVYAPKDNNYFYFSGIWHMRNALITPEIIANLQRGKSMLSVGSAEGHLERLLVEGFDVPKSSIDIGDIEENRRLTAYGFRFYQFDMTEKWPAFERKYDYIIFPECLGVALLHKERGINSRPITQRFHETAEKVENAVVKKEKIDASDRNLFMALVEQDVFRAIPTYKIVRRALENINPGGEVRISSGGGIQSQQQKVYTALKLLSEFSNLDYSIKEYGPAIFSLAWRKKARA